MTQQNPATSDAPPSKDPANNGATAKTVPEATFLALKESLESKVTELKTISETLASESAARKAVEAKVKELEPNVQKVISLALENEALNGKVTQHESAVLTQRKQALTANYGVPAEKLANLNADQLSVLEGTLPDVKRNGVPVRGMDAGSGGNGSSDPNLRASDRIALALKSGGGQHS